MLDESKMLEKLAQLYNRQEILITQVSRLSQKLLDLGLAHRAMKKTLELTAKEVFSIKKVMEETEWVE